MDAVAKNWNTAHQGDNSRVIALPPIWWGTSPHHKGYPGTVSLRIETFHNLLSDIFHLLSNMVSTASSLSMGMVAT